MCAHWKNHPEYCAGTGGWILLWKNLGSRQSGAQKQRSKTVTCLAKGENMRGGRINAYVPSRLFFIRFFGGGAGLVGPIPQEKVNIK